MVYEVSLSFGEVRRASRPKHERKKLMLFRSPLVYELSVLFDEFRRSSQKIIFPLFFFFYFRDGFR